MSIEIPELFCWAKVGAESGEGLQAIICRKELERQAGQGTFYWGVGNSVGSAVTELAVDGRHPAVVFSQMRAAPALKPEREPGALLLWRACLDRQGNPQKLPVHAVVTSRAPADPASQPRPHYALVCSSGEPLSAEAKGVMRFNELINYTSGRPLGYSHVTSLVKRRAAGAPRGGPDYPVLMVAALQPPYVVQLADPVLLPPQLAMSLGKSAANLDVDGWRRFAAGLTDSSTG
jgi:hypothetical protein